MKITESKEALCEALTSIAKSAEERGMKTEVKCFIADHDLVEVEADDASAALISGEISITADGNEDKIILECALSVSEGEVNSDEILREVNTVRGSMKEICDKFDESGNANEMIDALAKEQELDVPAPKVYDNKSFYIYGGIAIVAVLILVLIFG